MDSIKDSFTSLINPFEPVFKKLLVHLYKHKYQGIVALTIVAIGTMELFLVGLEFTYAELAKQRKDNNFYKGLEIAEMESAVEYLENCQISTKEKRDVMQIECTYALEKYSYQIATLGKSSHEVAKMNGNYVSELKGVYKEAIDNKAYSFMKSLLNAQIRRSKNAMAHGSVTFLESLVSTPKCNIDHA